MRGHRKRPHGCGESPWRFYKRCIWLVPIILLVGCGGSSTTVGPVATVTISPTTASLGIKQTVTLTATSADAKGNAETNQTYSWVSSEPSVATVDTNGVVTGVATGTAQITADDAGVRSNQSAITVNPPVTNVVVTPGGSLTIAVNATQQLTAMASANGQDVTNQVQITWKNSNAAVVNVSPSGLVTGISPGTALIVASVALPSGGSVSSNTVTINVTP
jgi:uncharacterized protein YjdB